MAEKRSWPSGDKAKHMELYTSTHPEHLHSVMLKPMDNLSAVSSRVMSETRPAACYYDVYD